jgi:serine protease Do
VGIVKFFILTWGWAPNRAFAEAAAQVQGAVVTIVVDGDEAKLAAKRGDEAAAAVEPIPPQLVGSFETRRPTPCIATGLLVDADGTIVTAAFNLGARTGAIWCYLADGERVPAKLLGADDWHDLAVLKIAPRPGLKPATLGDASKLAQGRSLAVLGRSEPPGGLTINAGTVSATRRYDATCCQISALIDYGNLGGPVIDLQGHVLGITAHLGEKTPWRQNCGVGFLLQAEVIRQVLPELAAGRKVERPERAFLGVRGDIGAMDVKGARITGVSENGPAAAAGLKTDDVITAFAGKPVGDWISLSRAIRESKVGDKVAVKFMRGLKPMTVTVTVGRME